MTFEQAEKAGRKDNRMMIWPQRARWLYEAAESVIHLDGEFWETGVYQGGSAKMISELIKASEKKHIFRLFDTFEGFADVTSKDGTAKNGDLKYWESVVAGVNSVRDFLDSDFVSIYPGRVPVTFAGLEDSRIAYAYLDTDLYYSIRGAMEFILPRMVSGGVIVIDDCGDPLAPGVEEAANETKGNLILEKRSCINPFEPAETAHVGWRGEIRIP